MVNYLSENFGGDGRESSVSLSGGGVCYKSCGVCVQPAFFLEGNPARMVWPSRRVQKLVYCRNLFSSILSIRICDRSAQFLVNCFKKFLWQKTIADLIQPTCFLVSEKRPERERSGNE